VSLVATFLAPAFLYPFFLAASAITGTRLIAYGAMSCAAMLVGTALSARWFGDSWSDATQMGRAGAGSWTLFGGLAAGWFAITIPSGLLVWSGALKIIPAEAGDWGSAALQAVVMLAPAALTEELMFRGYGFTLVQRQWGARTAVVSTSMAFALMHLLNPGVSVQSVVMVGLAGIFLAVVRLSFASLWAAWLAHFAYNFVQLAVFHTAVSGIALPQPYYRAVSAGPAWLTGGDWGPEAGVAAAGGLLVVSFLLAVRARWIRVIRRGGRIVIEQRPQGREEP
jgi:hypothetical protein